MGPRKRLCLAGLTRSKAAVCPSLQKVQQLDHMQRCGDTVCISCKFCASVLNAV